MLLKLPAEVVRLRRTARAFAAGECSQAEYRALRRDVIERFGAQPTRDDTERRQLGEADDTQRTLPDLLQDRQVSLSLMQDDRENAALETVAHRRRSVLLTVGLFVLLLVLAWPSLAADDAVRIPPVRDRAADPANSQRLKVAQVMLDAPEDLSAADRTLAEATLQRALAEAKAKLIPETHGFTSEELTEVARLLQAFGVHESGGSLSRSESDALQAAIERQKNQRELSVQQLEQVAAAVQAELREAGLLLAVVYVPAQRVDAGVVRIAVLPGRLGAVSVAGARSEATKRLVGRQFATLRGAIVTRSAFETRLGRLAEVPGLTSQVRVEPGRVAGSADLAVELIEARPWRFGARVDNHGFEDAGGQRVTGWIGSRNLLGYGERFDLSFTQGFGDGDLDRLALGYRQPWPATGTRIGARLLTADFEVAGLGGLGSLSGDVQQLEFEARQLLYQTRRAQAALELTLGQHRFDYEGFEDQQATFAVLALDSDRSWDALRLALTSTAALELGRLDETVRAGQDDNYYRLSLQGRLWHALRWTDRERADKLVLRWQAQWSDSDLVPTRSQALGSAAFNRGFAPYQLLADRGLSLALEWRRLLPLGEGYLFLDSAYGSSANDVDAGYASLNSAGLGWDTRWNEHFTSRLSLGVPLAGSGSPEPDDSGLQLYWRFDYAH